MPVEENLSTIRKLFDGLSRGDLSVIEDCMADDFVRHSPGWEDMSREQYRSVRARSIAAMPSRTTVDDIVAHDDRVAFRVTHRGMHSGSMMGRPASGNSFEVSEVYFARFQEGKIQEWWCLLDKASMDAQLSGNVTLPRRIE